MEVHSSPKASEDANGEIVGRKRKSLVCPYLDTIQRSVLDFDLEPSCSITLQTGAHIYACLVCGKYFRGRGRQTPAYTHAVEEAHFVFIHLLNGTFHCLPDDYEIENDNDASLDDIRAALHPRFTASQIRTLDEQATLSRDLFGRRYLPGFVGLNNLSKTDGINAVVQALAHVPPLRDYYLRQDTNTHTVVHHKHRQAKHVNDCFGQLVRKLWSDRRFKNHVDPHQLVQAVAVASKKRFQVGQQVEAGEFVAWFLHQLHIGTGGTKKAGSSIIHELFQGRVEVTNREAARPSNNKSKISVGTDDNDDDRVGSDDDGGGGEDRLAKKGSNHAEQLIPEVTETTSDTNFLQLTLDIPEKPLFRDEDGGLVIPQEPLSNILKKFDGITFLDAVSQSGHAQRKRYRLLQLPNYLILHLARFKTNRYNREKNPTIVMFPVRNLDLSEYVHHSSTDKEKPPTEEQVRGMTVSFPGDAGSLLTTMFLNSFLVSSTGKGIKRFSGKVWAGTFTNRGY